MVVGLAGFVLSVLNHLDQRDTKKKADRAWLATQEHAQHANLDFELRRRGELMLLARNLGPSEARAVEIRGLQDNGQFLRFAVFPTSLPGWNRLF